MPNFKTDLIKKFNDLRPLKKEQQLLTYLKKGNYNKVLLLACKNCSPADSNMFAFIKHLLSIQHSLKLDLNKVYLTENRTSVQYALENKHIVLHQLLVDHGAKPHDSLKAQSSEGASYLKTIIPHMVKIAHSIHPEYPKEYSELEGTFETLPNKEYFSNDHDNAKHDLERVQFIIKALQWILTYHTEEKRSSVELSSSQSITAQLAHIGRARPLLQKICLTISNLSGSLRSKYIKCFNPAPVKWITLEQLGGIVTYLPNGAVVSIPLTDKMLRSSSNTELSIEPLSEIITPFMEEMKAREDLIDSALNTVIQTDFPNLIDFFKNIEQDFTKVDAISAKPVTLFGIKTLTSYFIDLQNMLKVLHLMSPTQNQYPSISLEENVNYIRFGFEDKERLDPKCTISSHAALRLLQGIGELFTGKNLSRLWTDLDETIDWRALTIIRDVLCHQDEGDNHAKVMKLLADPELLQQIIEVELEDLKLRLGNLIKLRVKQSLKFEGDTDAHWQAVQKIAQQKNDQTLDTSAAPIRVRKVSQEDENYFILQLENYLKQNKEESPDSIQAKIVLCNEIFHIGTISKQQKGTILSAFPRKHMETAVYKKLKEILETATAKPTTSKEDRAKKRLETTDQSTERKEKAKNKFIGLEKIRELAESWSQESDKTKLLRPQSRVALAIEALENISNSFKVIGIDLSASNCAATIVECIKNNSQYRNFIEYNLTQFLQHLDTIQRYKEAQNCTFIKQNYERLRIVRNTLEHDNLLLDNLGSYCITLGDNLNLRQKLIIEWMIPLIELLPELQLINEMLLTKQPPSPQPLPAPIVTTSINAKVTLFKPEEKGNAVSNTPPPSPPM
jgi:uncharacterized protein with HEPN domain